MAMQPAAPKRERGVMLLEALVAILIFSIGVLAVVGMQATAVKTVTDSRTRSEAAFLANQLMSQVWTDAGNASSYAWDGTGTAPTRLTGWIAAVNSRLPGASVVPPVVTVTGATVQGATVRIVVRWQLPEEAAQGLPARNYTVVAAIYTS